MQARVIKSTAPVYGSLLKRKQVKSNNAQEKENHAVSSVHAMKQYTSLVEREN